MLKLRDGKKVGITEKTVRKGCKTGRTVNNCGNTASNMQASSTTRSAMKKGCTTGKTAKNGGTTYKRMVLKLAILCNYKELFYI